MTEIEQNRHERPATIEPLPPQIDLETKRVFKALAKANRALGELKGTARTLPNQGILIDTLFLQEALASSEIENIVTTQNEAFRAGLFQQYGSTEAKEVARYRDAMRHGYDRLKKAGGISENMLIEMFRILKRLSSGYRTASGTKLLNEATGQTVYTPPQDSQEIKRHMRMLEDFINKPELCALDPLIKMALIHHQFESIHPFEDGNGRVGRMLNVLYLTYTGLLDEPILYLSRAINRTKRDYYRLLQDVREQGKWEDWVIYMLDAVTETADSTLKLISEIRTLMMEYKHQMREMNEKVYSQDLLNNLFRYPYTRISYLQTDLGVHYNTAVSRLKWLTKNDFVKEVKQKHKNYYINERLVNLFLNVSAKDEQADEDAENDG